MGFFHLLKKFFHYFISPSILVIPLQINAYICTKHHVIRRSAHLKAYIEERTISLAQYIIQNKATVREAAKKFGISKSTVHKDVTERLLKINPQLAKSTKAILNANKAERHIRGGLATREKYLRKEKEKNIK